jgi:hypothetical protein
MLQNTEQKGGKTMAKSKDSDTKKMKNQKIKLGKLIKECRGDRTLRNVAAAVGLSPSNLKYIEDGVNAPSPKIYTKLMQTLEPKGKIKKDIERTYMLIREAPPPDVCKVITANEGLNDSLRIIEGHTLTKEQLKELNALLNSFLSNK